MKKILLNIFIILLNIFFVCSQSFQHTNAQVIVFNRITEPNENAFSVLVPKDWQTAGGIYRVDPTEQGGAAQSIAAKVDFTVKNDATGTVMIRWLPDVLFYDARYSPAGQMGLYPPGSNYNGMTVYPWISAQQFVPEIAFPYAHPNASNVRVIESKKLSIVAQNYQQRMRALMPMIDFSYDAALVTLSYTENRVRYIEKMMCVLENWGRAGAGMWGNKETIYIRTPEGEFAKYESVLSVIQNSIIINKQWLAGELRGQERRGEIMINTQREMNRIEQQITEHHQKTNAEIHNDMFLTLTDQEEYVNPFTNEIEMGSNQWKYRWENEAGEIIYTDNESYDPRVDVNLNRTDYKLTPIRKRFPE